MSKRKRSARTRRAAEPAAPAFERGASLALLLVSLAGLLWIITARPVLGVAGQHEYPYHPAPQRRALLVLALLAIPLGWLVVRTLRGRHVSAGKQAWLMVVGFALGSLVLRLGVAGAPKLYPGAELAFPCLWPNTEGAYAAEVRKAEHLGAFVATYADGLDVSIDRDSPRYTRVHHPQVHPPGLILCFAAIERFYDSCGPLRVAVEGHAPRVLPSVAVLDGAPIVPIRHPVAVALTAALWLIVLASLAPAVAFLAARRVWPTGAALAAAAAAALVPGTYLFSPSIDQAYPTLTLVLCWLAIELLATRRLGWGLAFGVALYGAMFLHVAYGLVGAIIGLAAVLAWRTRCSGRSLRELAASYGRPAAGVAVGFLAPAVVLWAWLGYPTFRVIALCLRNNALFNAMAKRTYWPWLTAAPFEFSLSLGFALSLLVACGWLLEVVAAARAGSLAGRSALLLAAGTVVLALHLAGMNRGETARLWLLLTPLLALGAIDAAWRLAGEPRRLLACVLGVQLLQIVLLSVFLDLGRTSTFFHTTLRKLPELLGR